MVEETIKTIKETENEADEIIRKADATCTEILEKAAREAKEIKEQAVEDGTGDRSIKSTGSGKRRGGGIRSHQSIALMIWEE